MVNWMSLHLQQPLVHLNMRDIMFYVIVIYFIIILVTTDNLATKSLGSKVCIPINSFATGNILDI